MNHIFEITEKEIAILDYFQLTDLMNHLLLVESDKIGISPHLINTTLKINEPDGGIDARILENSSEDNRWIPKGKSVWQYKSGDIKPSKLDNEINKATGVQEAIKEGATYCLVVGNRYEDRAINNRKEKLKKYFKNDI